MNYEEYTELQNDVKIGEEIALYYRGEEYWINFTREGVPLLTRSKDSYTQFFNNVDELFEKGTIDGRLLKDIYTEIE